MSLARAVDAAPPEVPFRPGRAFQFYLLVLAWSPFPLGSNREWSWSVLVILIAVCWLLWLLENWHRPMFLLLEIRRIAVPLLLALLVLGWSILQTLSWVPSAWKNPLWSLASDALGRPLAGAISINPWRSGTGAMKFGAYLAAGVLAFAFSRDESRAYLLLRWIVVIGGIYAIYAAILALSGHSQYELFYAGPAPKFGPLSGPFVLKNSYATEAGLISLCALAAFWKSESHWLGSASQQRFISPAMWRLIAERNAINAAVFFVSFSTLVACASRAGFLSTLLGLLAMLAILSLRRSRLPGNRIKLTMVGAIGLVLIFLIVLSGRTLDFRLEELAEAGGVDRLRLEIWQGGLRMIHEEPLFGFGLDTFEDAYPVYATHIRAAVMDKAHNDYIELAAGLGLPFAGLTLLSGFLFATTCLRAAFADHQDWPYSLLAFAATLLVAMHSIVDFSLQIPSIALLYVTILGLGLGRSATIPKTAF